jgi:hypothetical protein
VRRVFRRWLFWIVLAVVIIAVAAFSTLATQSAVISDPLASDNPAPAGAKAVASVLADEGVTVTATDSLAETTAAADTPADTTILLYDAYGILAADQVAELSGLSSHLVLIDPDFDTLRALAPDVLLAGSVEGDLDVDCALPAAARAGTVLGDGSGYRVSDDAPDDVTACFSSGDDVYSLVDIATPTGSVTVLGTTSALSNEFVGSAGNAALALNLLGDNPTLVWYIPGAADYAGEQPPTLAEITPEWVTPVVILVLLTALAAAIWRGRRMGALVIENLPVTVRASETMEGRARLYGTASARLHALDSLRIGTVERVAAACGLPRVATVEEVIAAASARTMVDPRAVRDLLLDAVPRTDGDLVRLSDALLDFEARVAAASRPNDSSGR